jgi:ssDNA-binding Zn-finger/Zn-ribbon topoisomerase 1
MSQKLPAWVHPPNKTWSGTADQPNEHDVDCPECGAKMRLRYTPKHDRHFYGCTRWPKCDGVHGCHPDGKPLGKPGNKETRSARMRAHEAFDQLWKPSGALMTRGQAYSWLEGYFDLDQGDAHIGGFSKEQCEELVAAVLTEFDITV